MTEQEKDNRNLVYSLEGKPPIGTAIVLGMQHVLAMFVGNLTPLLVVGGVYAGANPGSIDVAYLCQCGMVMAGIMTMVQLYRIGPIGSGLPIVMGTSSAFLGVNSFVASNFGWAALMGAGLVGGLFEMFIGSIIKHIRKVFPPLVTGVTVLSIGITLLPVGVQSMAGGGNPRINPNFGSLQNLAIASIVFLVIIFLKTFGKGLANLASMLIAMIIGYMISLIMYLAIPPELQTFNFTLKNFMDNGLFSFPVPFKYGIEFHAGAIIPMLFMFIVTAIETIGDSTGVAQGALNRDLTDQELRGTILADGFSSFFASIFNVSPLTSFSQNVGLVRMTKVVNRFTIATGAAFLILAGIFRPIGEFFSTIPPAVLGGAVIGMFGSIAVSGIGMLQKEKLNGRNTLIVALALGIGVGFGQGAGLAAGAMAHFPTWLQYIFGGNGIAAATIIAMVLNLLLPQEKEEDQVKAIV